jgi:hypothetical protein
MSRPLDWNASHLLALGSVRSVLWDLTSKARQQVISGGRASDGAVGQRHTQLLAFERGAAAVALDVHFEDGGVVDEAVDNSDRHSLVAEHGAMPQ